MISMILFGRKKGRTVLIVQHRSSLVKSIHILGHTVHVCMVLRGKEKFLTFSLYISVLLDLLERTCSTFVVYKNNPITFFGSGLVRVLAGVGDRKHTFYCKIFIFILHQKSFATKFKTKNFMLI